MYNKDVLDRLIAEFGFEKAILYCKMEAKKNELMFLDSRERGDIGSSEWKYERDWWSEKEKELFKTKIKNDENDKPFRKLSKSSNSRKTVASCKNVG